MTFSFEMICEFLEFLLEKAVLVDEDGAVIIPEHVEDPELASAKEIPG